MTYMSKAQLREHLLNAPSGTTPGGIVAALRAQGVQMEGDPSAHSSKEQVPFMQNIPEQRPIKELFGAVADGLLPALGGVAGGIGGSVLGPVGSVAGAGAGAAAGVAGKHAAKRILGLEEPEGALGVGADEGKEALVQGAIGAASEGAGQLLTKGITKIANAAKPTAEWLYQTALKPTAAVQRKFPDVVRTGLREGIVLSGASADDVAGLIDDLDQTISSRITDAGKSNALVQIDDVIQRLDDTKKFFGETIGGSKYLEQLDDLADTFKKERLAVGQAAGIPVANAQALKQNTYKLLRKAYGELKSAETEGMKDLARGLKEEIAKRVPEISALNKRQSELIGLDAAITDFLRRSGNRELIGLAPGVGVGAGAVKEGLKGAVKGAGIAKLVKYLADSPKLKSTIAIALDRLGDSMSLSPATKKFLENGVRAGAQTLGQGIYSAINQ